MLEEISNRQEMTTYASPHKKTFSEFNNELQESPGTKILKYVQSEYFG